MTYYCLNCQETLSSKVIDWILKEKLKAIWERKWCWK